MTDPTRMIDRKALEEARKWWNSQANPSLEGFAEAYEKAKLGNWTLKAVLDLLTADPRKDIYACQGGGYAISHGGGRVSLEIIEEGLRKGLLKEKYAGQNLAVWKSAV